MKKGKRHTARRIVIGVLLVAALAGAGVGAYALYGSAQLEKIPGLTAWEALNYTLSGCGDGVITVGIIQNGEASYAVYGEDGAQLPAALHTYEIGSVTKTFTAAMVCAAVQEGTLALDAPVDAYLSLPAKAHYPTLGELVTHTSGYQPYYFASPMISNFLNGRNDFCGIGDSTVLDRLADTDIADESHPFAYSNFGYATLGLVLEKTYATEYTTLMNGFLHDTLGLTHTQMSDGSLENGWDWTPSDTYLAAGGLTSDIEDMLQYARLQLDGAVCGGACLESLKEISATSARYEKLGIRMDEIAYGWLIDTENGYVWHNGGTGDYNCYLGLDLENGNAVVVLSNLSPDYRIPATVIGVKLLGELKAGAN